MRETSFRKQRWHCGKRSTNTIREIGNRTRTEKGSQKIRHFNGRFGALMIFDEALSESEISDLHKDGNKYYIDR